MKANPIGIKQALSPISSKRENPAKYTAAVAMAEAMAPKSPISIPAIPIASHFNPERSRLETNSEACAEIVAVDSPPPNIEAFAIRFETHSDNPQPKLTKYLACVTPNTPMARLMKCFAKVSILNRSDIAKSTSDIIKNKAHMENPTTLIAPMIVLTGPFSLNNP